MISKVLDDQVEKRQGTKSDHGSKGNGDSSRDEKGRQESMYSAMIILVVDVVLGASLVILYLSLSTATVSDIYQALIHPSIRSLQWIEDMRVMISRDHVTFLVHNPGGIKINFQVSKIEDSIRV